MEYNPHKPMCRSDAPVGGRRTVATNLHLDDGLVEHARRIGKHRTKREAVTAALEEYVRRREQLKILELEGTIDYDPDYDYKADRRRGDRRLPKDEGP
jgi:Arc/MetJ family transcription regulator